MTRSDLSQPGKFWRYPVLIALLWFASRVFGQDPPQTFDGLVSEANAAREHNDVPRAIELYTQTLEVNPKWTDGWWFLGSLEYQAGSYAAAKAALSHFLELKPNAAPALALRGLCEFETNDFQSSLGDIQQAISHGAANDFRNTQILRYHEALLLTRLGRFEDALKSYSFFAERKIPSPELFVAIGLAGLRRPLLPKDVSAEQQALLAGAGNAAFQFMAGEENEAQMAFSDLFQRFPALPNLHYFYGYLLFATDPDAAVPEFERELDITPANVTAQIMAAWALLLRNRASQPKPVPSPKRRHSKSPACPQLSSCLAGHWWTPGTCRGASNIWNRL